MRTLIELWRDESGQDLIEYALTIVLVALGAIVGMSTLASDINSVFGAAGSDLTSAAT
jgi:pilus assembly protein Flp/PilA